jgi:hypothetical protein
MHYQSTHALGHGHIPSTGNHLSEKSNDGNRLLGHEQQNEAITAQEMAKRICGVCGKDARTVLRGGACDERTEPRPAARLAVAGLAPRVSKAHPILARLRSHLTLREKLAAIGGMDRLQGGGATRRPDNQAAGELKQRPSSIEIQDMETGLAVEAPAWTIYGKDIPNPTNFRRGGTPMGHRLRRGSRIA